MKDREPQQSQQSQQSQPSKSQLAGIGQLREVQASSHDHAPNFDVCLGPALGEFGFLALDQKRQEVPYDAL